MDSPSFQTQNNPNYQFKLSGVFYSPCLLSIPKIPKVGPTTTFRTFVELEHVAHAVPRLKPVASSPVFNCQPCFSLHNRVLSRRHFQKATFVVLGHVIPRLHLFAHVSPFPRTFWKHSNPCRFFPSHPIPRPYAIYQFFFYFIT